VSLDGSDGAPLVSDRSLGATLLRVVEITAEAIPAAELAGVAMLGTDGRRTTGVFNDPEAPEIDHSQYDSGSGPCLDASRTRSIVRIEVMAQAKDDHPAFATTCLEHGVHSTLSLPLVAAGTGVGALNLYGAA
jgi:hypothetical protein